MSETIEPRIQHSTLSGLLEPFSTGSSGRTEILGLNGSSDAWFSAGLLAREDPVSTLLVVAPDQVTAQRFYRALVFYHGIASDILFFPNSPLNRRDQYFFHIPVFVLQLAVSVLVN